MKKLDFADYCLLLGALCMTAALAITYPPATLYFWGFALISLGIYKGL